MTDLIYTVRHIFDSTTIRGCLQQNRCSAYSIPAYQRGYKWGSEDTQPVERLLSDLLQTWQRKEKEYLLQAITVKSVADEKHGRVLEVIDGQQRLTTLFILIQVMARLAGNSAGPDLAEGKLRYRIRHGSTTLHALVAGWLGGVENPKANFAALKATCQVEREESQDGYYLRCAALRCLSTLAARSDLAAFQDFVFDGVKLMVNPVEAHVSSETIFGNLNSNRVPLTETELIKGLLLTRAARQPAAGHPRRYREVLEARIQLGRQWDELNHWANRPEIRSLYFPTFDHGRGMEGLLELAAQQMPKAYKPAAASRADVKNPLFEYLLAQRDLTVMVRRLGETRARLEDWYTDYRNYHLLGFCLSGETDRSKLLVELLRLPTKAAWKARLLELRRKMLPGVKNDAGEVATPAGIDLAGLRYGEDDRIGHALLALSVFHREGDGRFDFHAYQTGDWTLEHIFPQTPFGKGAVLTPAQKKEALDILIENGGGVLTPEAVEKLKTSRETAEAMDPDWVKAVLRKVPLLHSIGNLCLLSRGDNAAMGCGMFSNKRREVRKRIAQGSFVPRHTYEVFSKMIVDEKDGLDVWSREDIKKHEGVIRNRIQALVEEKA